MNDLYGLRTVASTLMYNHIQTLEEAAEDNSSSLIVTPDTFRSQMEYL